MNIVEFLDARLADDEEVARATQHFDGPHTLSWALAGTRRSVFDNGRTETYSSVKCGDWDRILIARDGKPYCVATHVARHDPARVLREVAIKRHMLEMERPGFGRDGVVCNGHPGPFMNHGDYGPGYCGEPDEFSIWYQFASVYSHHPDYNPEWANRTMKL